MLTFLVRREIQKRGFRDLRTSKTPESSSERPLYLCFFYDWNNELGKQ